MVDTRSIAIHLMQRRTRRLNSYSYQWYLVRCQISFWDSRPGKRRRRRPRSEPAARPAAAAAAAGSGGLSSSVSSGCTPFSSDMRKHTACPLGGNLHSISRSYMVHEHIAARRLSFKAQIETWMVNESGNRSYSSGYSLADKVLRKDPFVTH